MPVSGPFFPLQLTSLYLVQKAINNSVPDLILATSGGGAVSAIGQSAGWNADEIWKVAEKFDSTDIFEKPSCLAPAFFNWAFTGSLMCMSRNIYKLCDKFLTGKTQSPEIIFGTYCKNTNSHHLFSSVSKERGRFEKDDSSTTITFLDGDIPSIARALMASAAVPNVIDPVCILPNSNWQFMDGGISAPSPWSSLWESIVSRPGDLKIIYFISTMTIGISPFKTLDIFYRLYREFCMREHVDLIFAFKNRCKAKSKLFVELETSKLEEAIKIYKSSKEAVLLTIPAHKRDYYNFSMFNFKGKELQSIMRRFGEITYLVVAAL